MMPELGKYAFAVSWSYICFVVGMGGLIAVTIWQRNKVRRALKQVEARKGKTNG